MDGWMEPKKQEKNVAHKHTDRWKAPERERQQQHEQRRRRGKQANEERERRRSSSSACDRRPTKPPCQPLLFRPNQSHPSIHPSTTIELVLSWRSFDHQPYREYRCCYWSRSVDSHKHKQGECSRTWWRQCCRSICRSVPRWLAEPVDLVTAACPCACQWWWSS